MVIGLLSVHNYIICAYNFISAGVAELADAPDLGSGGRPCRFDSCHPHYLKETDVYH